jgi:sulfofructose kinase
VRIPLHCPPRGSRPYDVVGLGESSLDVVGVGGVGPAIATAGGKTRLDSLEIAPGGQITTALVACARLGWRARYHGYIGDDRGGAEIRTMLAREGVEVAPITRPGLGSRMAIILVDRQTGDRTVLGHRDPRVVLDGSDVDLDVVTSGRALIVDAVDPAASLAAARAARAARVRTLVDLDRPGNGVEDLLGEIDVLIVSRDFPTAFTGATSTGAALRALADRFRPAIAVVTLGEDGSLALVGGREIRTPAARGPVVDTTGAGDAFRGGFLSAWLEAGPETTVESVLTFATIVAAISCSQIGAMAGLPDRAAVERLVTAKVSGQSK